MKRRSPWLTFAACVLVGASSPAATAVKPVLNLSQALSAAEAELMARGLGKDHSISSIQAVHEQGDVTRYVATIFPEVTAKEESTKALALVIDSAGKVTDTTAPSTRIGGTHS